MVELEIAYKRHLGGAGDWLLYRIGGDRTQHGHFRKLRDAERVRNCVYGRIWPDENFFRESICRLLTADEIYDLMGVEIVEDTGLAAQEVAGVRQKPKKKRKGCPSRRGKHC